MSFLILVMKKKVCTWCAFCLAEAKSKEFQVFFQEGRGVQNTPNESMSVSVAKRR